MPASTATTSAMRTPEELHIAKLEGLLKRTLPLMQAIANGKVYGAEAPEARRRSQQRQAREAEKEINAVLRRP